MNEKSRTLRSLLIEYISSEVAGERATEREAQRGQFASGPQGPGDLINLYLNIFIYSLYKCIQGTSQ